jgi:N-acetylmuramoyl-L-alanine amidase
MISDTMRLRVLTVGFLEAVALVLLVAGLDSAGAQEELGLQGAAGPLTPGIRTYAHRGYATFPAGELKRLGWEVRDEGEGLVLRWGARNPRVEIFPENPFLLWDGEPVQLADVPYRLDGQLFLPVQFLVDVLTWKLPGAFRYEVGSWRLEVLETPGDPAGRIRGPAGSEGGTGSAARPGGGTTLAGDSAPPSSPPRVVIIDAGHGGRDPGTVGRSGVREKDVALGIALRLAEVLKDDEKLEVYLTRDDDTLVPIWRRGELATEWKGGGYGVFLSIHANALPGSPGTRGYETYFLSEARTEHERRVAALENAAMELEDDGGPPEQTQDMSFILSELRNLDIQHWSALLAEYIQTELSEVHPGPDRGVKQGPFAVITNTLMPAVLVEVGFLSNREEERLLTQQKFQEDTAQALAAAVHAFLTRYPPGPEGSGGPARS